MIENIQGFKFPFRFDERYGRPQMLSGAEKIRQDLLLMLGTRLGERAMARDYGTRLASMVHEPNDDVLRRMIEEQVRNALIQWEPRVLPVEIRVEQKEGELKLFLTYVLVHDSRT